MTREEIIQGLQFTIDMFLFDPTTGEMFKEPRNDMDKTTIDACREAIKALEQQPTTKDDLTLIHTEGLDEEIRCTMCTNHMKSDRGCDGSCVVNKDMYKAVMDAIEKRIQTNPIECEDAISRKDTLEALEQEEPLVWCDGADEIAAHNQWSSDVDTIKNMPTVQPKIRVGHCVWCSSPYRIQYYWIDRDGNTASFEDENKHIVATGIAKYCPNCGTKMIEPQYTADECTYRETGCGSCKRQLDCPITANRAESENKE